MNKNIIIAVPCLALLTACGGSSTGGSSFEAPPSLEELQSAPAGSVVISADTPVEAASFEQLAAIDFTSSPIGSSIAIVEGELAGLSITKAASIGGKTTITISQPGATETATEIRGTVSDILKLDAEFIGVEGEETFQVQNINGTDVYFETDTRNSGTKTSNNMNIGINGTQGSVEATILSIEIGDDILAAAFGVKREFEGEISPNYEAPTAGNFLYAGLSSLFGDDDGHTSNTATMVVNFEDLTGTFSASGFEPDEESVAKVISIESALTINNTSGTISSTSGTITVDGVSGDIGVNGMLAFDNNAAAGTLIPTAEVDGIAGGIFVLPRTQP